MVFLWGGWGLSSKQRVQPFLFRRLSLSSCWVTFYQLIHRNMKIQLDRFEEQIDEVILQRGLNYFKKGYVTDVEEIGLGDYEATVNGRDIYGSSACRERCRD